MTYTVPPTHKGTFRSASSVLHGINAINGGKGTRPSKVEVNSQQNRHGIYLLTDGLMRRRKGLKKCCMTGALKINKATLNDIEESDYTIFSLWRNSPTRAQAASLLRFPDYTHSDTPHSVRHLWTSDQPAQRPLPQNTQHPCPWRNSNRQSQQPNGCSPTPYSARPQRLAITQMHRQKINRL
jgi:hypothetical protein